MACPSWWCKICARASPAPLPPWGGVHQRPAYPPAAAQKQVLLCTLDEMLALQILCTHQPSSQHNGMYAEQANETALPMRTYGICRQCGDGYASLHLSTKLLKAHCFNEHTAGDNRECSWLRSFTAGPRHTCRRYILSTCLCRRAMWFSLSDCCSVLCCIQVRGSTVCFTIVAVAGTGGAGMPVPAAAPAAAPDATDPCMR